MYVRQGPYAILKKYAVHVAYEYCDEYNFVFNPKPHGRGRICPHFFQRLISQKVLKC
jgi:hypothetical protein